MKTADPVPCNPKKCSHGHMRAASEETGQADQSGKYEAVNGRPTCKGVVAAGVFVAICLIVLAIVLPGGSSRTVRQVVVPPLPPKNGTIVVSPVLLAPPPQSKNGKKFIRGDGPTAAATAKRRFWTSRNRRGAPAPLHRRPPSKNGQKSIHGGGPAAAAIAKHRFWTGRHRLGPPAPLPRRCDSVNVPKESKCTGCPPMYKGKLCASTTRYNDRTKGSCGCGRTDPVPDDWWTLTNYTAALNCINLDPERPFLSWCPSGCGGCFRLCSTGGTTSGKPGITETDTCRTFKVTNRCGDGYKQYPEWCSNELTWQQCQDSPALCSKKGSTNKFGYPAHFDLQDFHLQVSKGLGWDNAEVTFEVVPCEEHWQSSAAACPSCAQGNMSFI